MVLVGDSTLAARTGYADEEAVGKLPRATHAVRKADAALTVTGMATALLGGNPAFTAPADVPFTRAIEKVNLRVHLSAHSDETSALCQWHVPEAHFLESWSDARAFDGTASIVQPLIAPLYGGRSAHEVVATLSERPERSAHDLVRGNARPRLRPCSARREHRRRWRNTSRPPRTGHRDTRCRRRRPLSAGLLGAVLGMTHRGRLNVLVNTLGKPPRKLFDEFEGKFEHHSANRAHTGDVKYHMGFSADLATPGGPVHVALAFNPSHLEIVDPVVVGSVRSRQNRRGDKQRTQVLPVLLHGDAAFAGQGIVMETLQLANLPHNQVALDTARQAELAAGRHRSLDHDGRAEIASHGVDRDLHGADLMARLGPAGKNYSPSTEMTSRPL